MPDLVIISVSDVEAEVQRIREIGSGDPEAAHALEDALHVAVLRKIAESSDDVFSSALAIAALETTEIKFDRWCA